MFAVAAFATEEVSDVLAPVSELKVTDFIQKDTVKTKSKTIVVKKVNENVIVFVDGVEKDAKAINQIDSSDIKEVRIFKGEKAVEQYGDKAKDTDGVIIITTKYSEKRGEEDVKFVEKVVVKMSDTEAKPLYVVDGITLEPGDLEKINPKSIDSLSVLKGEAATKLYGEKGKSGVVVITLKK